MPGVKGMVGALVCRSYDEYNISKVLVVVVLHNAPFDTGEVTRHQSVIGHEPDEIGDPLLWLSQLPFWSSWSICTLYYPHH